MVFETDNWPFVQAKHFQHWTEGRRPVRLIVIHDMEAPETIRTAENVAAYFQHPDYPSSCHICVDSDSIVQCVKDNDIAYAAPGANKDGIQIELAGYGRQTRMEWLDPYGIKLLALASDATAQYCLKYGFEPKHLSNAELKAGRKGIVGHVQVSQVYHMSDHTDPGLNFPWDYFLAKTAICYNKRLNG